MPVLIYDHKLTTTKPTPNHFIYYKYQHEKQVEHTGKESIKWLKSKKWVIV
jgi:hypothetical protein